MENINDNNSKNVSTRLSKKSIEELEDLCNEMKENRTMVIKRAITLLHAKEIEEKNEKI